LEDCLTEETKSPGGFFQPGDFWLWTNKEQAFKYASFIDTWGWLSQENLALLSGLFFGLLWGAAAVEAYGGSWTVAATVGIFYRELIGSLVAALFYGVILKE
jgi:hypothetical protein